MSAATTHLAYLLNNAIGGVIVSGATFVINPFFKRFMMDIQLKEFSYDCGLLHNNNNVSGRSSTVLIQIETNVSLTRLSGIWGTQAEYQDREQSPVSPATTSSAPYMAS